MRPPDAWLRTTPAGLRVEPGGFVIDPIAPVERALVTHAHGDHARPGSRHVLATAETLAIMRARYGDDAYRQGQAAAPGETIAIGGVAVRLVPAGHVLGSAQVVLEHGGVRVVVTGDYKRRRDPTCAPFELVRCDVLVTEATFGLPVFRHPDDRAEIARLLASRAAFPERAQLVGVYALGKCQRVIALLREAGYERPIYLHGALVALCDLYRAHGVELGELRHATGVARSELAGEIVLAPPGALADRWTRRLPDPVVALASGWMRIRQRARQRGVELPLVISDHADWDELNATIADSGAAEIWVTHGREEALVHQASELGLAARALGLTGFEEEGS
ncbi:MAG TPA: ligase-associated DNA damage response exonuclease [Burkholderiales bacterium]|nr:ligase-associated DNA damage response exonuclease [Burkholderiales bacterium]